MTEFQRRQATNECSLGGEIQVAKVIIAARPQRKNQEAVVQTPQPSPAESPEIASLL
jgi:hypothetical protein